MATKISKPINNKNANEIKELKEKLARSMADYINLEKRVVRDKEFIAALATSTIVTQMIEVLDNLNLAQSHLQDSGLKLAVDQFVSVLKNFGLQEIDPLSADFDPKTMECIKVSSGEDNKVIQVLKKGYVLNDQVLRPAQVIVGKTQN